MPVGVEDGRIPDGALTASSYHSENYHPSRARLNLLSTKHCWAAKKNDANQWLQVCFHLFSPFASHCNRSVVSSRSLFLEGPDNYQIHGSCQIWKAVSVYIRDRGCNRAFSHDVTVAILVFQNNETAAMLVYQDNPEGVELVSYVKAFF